MTDERYYNVMMVLWLILGSVTKFDAGVAFCTLMAFAYGIGAAIEILKK